MNNLYDIALAKRTVSPATRVNGTVNGTAVDKLVNGGAEGALVLVQTGTITDGSHAVAVEDSDDGSTGWAAVPAAQLQGTAPTIVAADDDKLFEVGVVASKRYLRVSVVTTGATTGGLFAAAIVLGEFRHLPVSHS
jgi:hypothetical protein